MQNIRGVLPAALVDDVCAFVFTDFALCHGVGRRQKSVNWAKEGGGRPQWKNFF